MKLQNIITAGLAIAISMLTQSAFAQDVTPAAHDTGGQISPSHFVPWSPIKESEITYKKRLWENISLNDGSNKNKIFTLADSRKPLLKILVDGVIKGKIKAYSAVNDRFTHEFTQEEFLKYFQSKHVAGSQVTTYAIKEDYIITKSGEKTTRIVGLAPVIATTQPDGTVKEEPMFWVFYPECRRMLADYQVDENVTWDDIFERQEFTGIITKAGNPWGNTAAGKLK